MKIPQEINFHHKSRQLELRYEGDEVYKLTYEFLRVFSPSAEVRGHSPSEAKLQVGKRDVTIVDVEPVGEYALKIIFSDGHDSGIYTWDWLAELADNYQELWDHYLAELKVAGASRDPRDPANQRYNPEPKSSRCKAH